MNRGNHMEDRRTVGQSRGMLPTCCLSACDEPDDTASTSVGQVCVPQGSLRQRLFNFILANLTIPERRFGSLGEELAL